MRVRNSNDIPVSKTQRETQISNARQIHNEALQDGDTALAADAARRLDHLLDNYAQEENIRRR
ncbi:hypothetical protein [Streptomyces heilongjiangensis]|uniref:Uncharacterized protein n=1 Tax=Streptomyces heilongjiangensis TaxID=945052 RepID=A0ABW1B3K0_9ACTN|nr:hypothetical protein [Streptomyces heilongjiangensis]MDC2952468.1 hypothetical protein [Streptomyces heilongjiangensis]